MLVTQNLRHHYIVLYNASGKNVASTVVDRLDYGLNFIVDCKAYYFSTNDLDCAHYLCAFLNSTETNDIIKPFQACGLYGERNINSKILKVPFPEFDAAQGLHAKLAGLSMAASCKAKRYVEDGNFDVHGGNMKPVELGGFRQTIRTALKDEISEIDETVKKIIRKHGLS